jgi:serine/threonine protein kinase
MEQRGQKKNEVQKAEVEITPEAKQRVKAAKHFMYEYYLGWFKYLNQRKSRVEKVEKDIRLMPGESGLTHKLEHFKKESQYLRQRRRKMRLGEFQLLALLGKGAFGSVYLGRKRDTGEVVAVKKNTKAQFDASNKDRVLREKKVLQVASQNVWLVGLSYAFQDKDHLYLAMEYIPGGDLRGLLKNIGCLEEQMATFYLVEMIASVAALHKLGYTHRDLVCIL